MSALCHTPSYVLDIHCLIYFPQQLFEWRIISQLGKTKVPRIYEICPKISLLVSNRNKDLNWWIFLAASPIWSSMLPAPVRSYVTGVRDLSEPSGFSPLWLLLLPPTDGELAVGTAMFISASRAVAASEHSNCLPLGIIRRCFTMPLLARLGQEAAASHGSFPLPPPFPSCSYLEAIRNWSYLGLFISLLSYFKGVGELTYACWSTKKRLFFFSSNTTKWAAPLRT